MDFCFHNMLTWGRGSGARFQLCSVVVGMRIYSPCINAMHLGTGIMNLRTVNSPSSLYADVLPRLGEMSFRFRPATTEVAS